MMEYDAYREPVEYLRSLGIDAELVDTLDGTLGEAA